MKTFYYLSIALVCASVLVGCNKESGPNGTPPPGFCFYIEGYVESKEGYPIDGILVTQQIDEKQQTNSITSNGGHFTFTVFYTGYSNHAETGILDDILNNNLSIPVRFEDTIENRNGGKFQTVNTLISFQEVGISVDRIFKPTTSYFTMAGRE